MPVIHIPDLIYTTLSTHAEESYPHEACGLFTGFFSSADDCIMITGYTASINLADNPHRAFIIDPATHIQLQKTVRITGEITGESIIGVYHSHPDGKAVPSESDKKNAVDRNFLWMIAAVQPKKECDIRCYLIPPEEDDFLLVDIKIIH